MQTAVPPMGLIEEVDTFGLKVTILKTALELDIFNTIATGRARAQEIARALECQEHGLRVLLDALAVHGLLEKAGDSYALTPTSRCYLIRSSPTCCADIYLAWLRARERLADVICTGTPSLDLTAPEADDLWASYGAPDLLRWPQLAGVLRERWTQIGLAPESLQGASILDVACGSGILSRPLAQVNSTLRVAAVDNASTLAVTRRMAEAMGVASQISYHPSDVLNLRLEGERFDFVVLGRILYYFEPRHVEHILRTCRALLHPGAHVLIFAAMPDDERRVTVEPLTSAVELLGAAPSAEVYTFPEYQRMLQRAGYHSIRKQSDRLITALAPV
jgi:2-polyprenyl-3-methyl-5-hydroxy-6-metoxy-1,4-benzoquinol methylase